ncbi:MAG: DNA topoisomerase 3 [Desulfurella sp.]
MKLFIAKKPSLARAIADAIGIAKKTQTHIVCSNGDIVTWCFGHLLELAKPDEYTRNKQWSLDQLPIIPEKWKKVPNKDAVSQIKAINRLISDLSPQDVIVNAGDPDREGQLLVDEVIENAKYKGKVLRLWVQALDKQSMLAALDNLKPNKEYKNLMLSAQYRSYADWLVGMNFTRVFTKKNDANLLLPVGRVKTPTLALIYQRYIENKNFKPKDFYVLENNLNINNRFIKCTLVTKLLNKGIDDENRLIDKQYALEIAKATSKVKALIKDVKEEQKTELAPLPFSLSKLQKYMSDKYSWKAKQTLDVLQKLYEKKLVTYQRTDCEYLPEEQLSQAKSILQALSSKGLFKDAISGCDLSLKHKAWDTSKITAHHAIIPTVDTTAINSLDDYEKTLYETIAKSYILLFYKPFVYKQITISVDINNYPFQSVIKKVIQKGWRSVFGTDEPEVEYPSVKKGEIYTSSDTEIKTQQTTPPPLFTDGTIIDAMHHIHKYITDEKAKAILKEKDGIGTEATRAAIIEELIKDGYVVRKGKTLESVLPLVENILRAFPSQVKDPVTTARWESMLTEIENGNKQAIDNFYKEQVNFVTKIVEEIKTSPNIHLDIRGLPNKKSPTYYSKTNSNKQNKLKQTTKL